jgi:hypothetical protein
LAEWPRGAHIAEVDILRSYLGLLCLGKSDYQAITAMQEDEYFKRALGIVRMPSVERLRQRLDEAGATLVPVINRCSRTMIKRLNAPITGYKSGLVPLDVDVFPQDNSKTKEEGVSRTYKNYDGYAPIAAYLGMEGWCLEVELRPGSQHSQNGFVGFVKRAIAEAQELIKQPMLLRADAGNVMPLRPWSLWKTPRTRTTSSNGIPGEATSLPGGTRCLPKGRCPELGSKCVPLSSRSARRLKKKTICSS